VNEARINKHVDRTVSILSAIIANATLDIETSSLLSIANLTASDGSVVGVKLLTRLDDKTAVNVFPKRDWALNSVSIIWSLIEFKK
jgi:hypothetical protein